MTRPDDCVLCRERAYNEDGSPIGHICVYQLVDGKIEFRKDFVIGPHPICHVHKTCIEELAR